MEQRTDRLVQETKVHLDGRRETFTCELLALDSRGAVITWRTPVAIERGGFVFPAGAVTTAYFWRRRMHNLYRFETPDGGLIGHRLDVIRPAVIGPAGVSYVDLALDIVVRPGEKPVLEDEDELEAAVAAGLLRPEDAQRITKYGKGLLYRFGQIIDEAARWW
ncbi:MAG: DUF402 domain-containing protein [Dehalococcoidia bacterium]